MDLLRLPWNIQGRPNFPLYHLSRRDDRAAEPNPQQLLDKQGDHTKSRHNFKESPLQKVLDG
jgi:hypothetical protein